MHEDAPEPIVHPRTYFLVCASLFALTLLTIGLAYVNLGSLNTPLALGIALVKAVLICLFFMNLKCSDAMHRLTLIAAVVWLGILIAGTMDDLLTRTWLTVPGK